MRSGITAIAAGVAALAVTAPVLPVPASASADTARSAQPARTVTRSAHVAFENCNARHIVLSVSVAGRAFTASEPVTFTVRLRNTGRTTCGAPLVPHVPEARRSLTVGPCGTLSLVVRTALGVEVFPGPVAYFCPAEVGFRLGPGSTATTIGSWDQSEAIGSSGSAPTARHAPPGRYLLTVDRAVSVPVTLTSG
jgi:hypothetical protein